MPVGRRRVRYWRSRHPIPGGIAFENFELRERFHDGQRSVFGITRRTPGELGFPPAGKKLDDRSEAHPKVKARP